MKKTIYFLFLFFFISCNTNKEPILNSKSGSISFVGSNEELVVSDISKQIGNLHNASIEAFIEYVYLNKIDVYKLNESQIDSVIIEFTNEYLIDNLLSNEEIVLLFENEETQTDSILLREIQFLIFEIIDSEQEYEVINSKIDATFNNRLSTNVNIQTKIINNSIKQISLSTNTLWSNEWDYSFHPFLPEEYRYTKEGNGNAETENDKEKKKKDQDALIKADIEGAIEGAIDGAIWGGRIGIVEGPLGGVLGGAWGALIGASGGAVVGSIKEYISQEISKTQDLYHSLIPE